MGIESKVSFVVTVMENADGFPEIVFAIVLWPKKVPSDWILILFNIPARATIGIFSPLVSLACPVAEFMP
jgi:hypothetical protein